MKRVLVISLAVVLALCLSTLALPANTVMAANGEIHVPKDYSTIQEALTVAGAGDVIIVGPGTYNEDIEMKIGVTIQGSGANVTTIRGTGNGPVVYANSLGSGAKLDGFTITNGSAILGGGIYLQVESSPTIINCIITGNSAGVYGGGIFVYDNSSPTITNCISANNTALNDGGGIAAFYSSHPTVMNCTITGNSATNGGGIASLESSSPTITNSIIYGNTATVNGPNIYNDSSSSTTNVTYSCVGGGYAGTGNISDDPSFVPAAGDYHLQSGSPCIDVGDNNAPGILEFDLDGNDRVADGDGVGGPVVDMGAYEAAAVIDTIPVEIDIKPGSDPNSVNPDSKGVIPVAILTTADFDAASVNVTTVSFGPDEASPAHYALEDVNDDGDTDMILHFKTQETGITAGDTEATLRGKTTDGKDIVGTDSVRTVPPKGKKGGK